MNPQEDQTYCKHFDDEIFIISNEWNSLCDPQKMSYTLFDMYSGIMTRIKLISTEATQL